MVSDCTNYKVVMEQPVTTTASTYLLIDDIAYPGLRWGENHLFDTAIELGLFNKVDLTVGYFNKKTTDLIANVPLASSSGVGSMTTNNGAVRSRVWSLKSITVFLTVRTLSGI